MRWLAGLFAVLLLVTLSPLAASQAFLSPGEVVVELGPGQTGQANFTLKNAVNHSLQGFARLEGDLSEGATLQTPEFRVRPLSDRTLTLDLSADGFGQGEHKGRLVVVLVEPEEGATQTLRSNLTVDVPSPTLLFDTWANPMPAPLDNVYGLFLLETSVWIVAGFLVMAGARGGTKAAMGKTPGRVKREVVSKFTTPLFFLFVVGGLREAWRFFPDEGVAGFFQGLLDAALVLMLAFFLYRLTDSVLVYLKEQVAPRTATKWDDVVLPVLRKVAVAMLGAFAFFYALQGVGVDLGFLVAGGLVVGLVLSNSLGPTLQNLFSGLFIMLDRPFSEGDDIRLDTGEVCNVRKIGLRSTRLYFYRNHEYIVAPNKDLENTRVVNLNFPDKRYKMHLVVGVAYGSPLDRVRELLLDAADEHEEVHVDEEMRSGVFFDDFGESALLLRLVVFVTDVGERFRIASELRDNIDAKFRENDITIPFPQRTLWSHDVDRRALGPGTYEPVDGSGGNARSHGARGAGEEGQG